MDTQQLTDEQLDALHDEILEQRKQETKIIKANLPQLRALYKMYSHRKVEGKSVTSGENLSQGAVGEVSHCAVCGVQIHLHTTHCSKCHNQLHQKKTQETNRRLEELAEINS